MVILSELYVLISFSIHFYYIYIIFIYCPFVFLRNRFAVNLLLFETSCLCLNMTPIQSRVLWKERPTSSRSLHSRKIEMLTSCVPRSVKMHKGSFTFTKCLHVQHSVPEAVFHTIKWWCCCSFPWVAQFYFNSLFSNKSDVSQEMLHINTHTSTLLFSENSSYCFFKETILV